MKRYTGLAVFLLVVELLIGYRAVNRYLLSDTSETYYLNEASATEIMNDKVILMYETEPITEPSAAADNTQAAAVSDTPETSSSDIEIFDEEEETVQPPVLELGGDTGEGTKVEIVSAQASSMISQEGKDNSAYAAVDGDESTSWQEGVSGSGVGEWVRYEFNGTRQISYITFKLGNWNPAEGKNYYQGNNRPKYLDISLGDQEWIIGFPDGKNETVLKFPTPVAADSITITISKTASDPEEVYKGESWDDTCISEIGIYEER